MFNFKRTSVLCLTSPSPALWSHTLSVAHRSPHTELDTNLLQRQRSFPGLSSPNVKMDSYTTQLGDYSISGRCFLRGSINVPNTVPPFSLLHLNCNWECPCLICMLCFRITSVIQAPGTPRVCKLPGVFRQLSEAKCGRTQHYLKVTEFLNTLCL